MRIKRMISSGLWIETEDGDLNFDCKKAVNGCHYYLENMV